MDKPSARPLLPGGLTYPNTSAFHILFILEKDLSMTDAASESPDFSNQALFTPAMRQFIEVKNRYPNTLVLFRMGDFYETFFKDAVIANRLIGITLTKRGKLTDGTPIPMAGIPAVSLDTYIARLVRQGESVVIVEPKKAIAPRR